MMEEDRDTWMEVYIYILLKEECREEEIGYSCKQRFLL